MTVYCARPGCGHRQHRHQDDVGKCCVRPVGHCLAFLSSIPPDPGPPGQSVPTDGATEANAAGITVPSVGDNPTPPTPPVSVAVDGASETNSAGITVPSTGTVPTPTRKHVVKGIFTRGMVPPANDPTIDYPTVTVNWSDLEPTQGNRTRVPLDNKINQLKSQGRLGVRVRVMCGFFAPPYVKNLGAGPVPYTNNTTGEVGTVPDYWSTSPPPLTTASANFWAWLAAQYDSDPYFRLVFTDGAMTRFGEPLYRGAELPENRSAFLAAGYTIAKDQEVQRLALRWMQGFTKTPVGLCYTPFQTINPDGTKGTTSITFVGQLMDYHLSLFGAQGTVLQSNELNAEDASHISPIEQLQFDRRNLCNTQYQTEPRKKLGNFTTTMEYAIDGLEATGVELPENWRGTGSIQGGTATDVQLADWDSRLIANGSGLW